MKKSKGLWLIGVCLLTSCKSPFDRTKDASGGGGTGTLTGSAHLVIFSDELVSGGGAFLYPGAEGQSLTFNDTSNSLSRRSIRYAWTGQAVSNVGCPAQNPTHNFAGFDLMHTATQADYARQGRDLRATGYSKMTFYARGSLSSNTVLKVEVASPGSPSDACASIQSPCITLSANGTDDACSPPSPAAPNPYALPPRQLTSSWQSYTITFPNSQLANVRDFFKATYVFTDLFPGSPAAGQGGTVYFDIIQYEP